MLDTRRGRTITGYVGTPLSDSLMFDKDIFRISALESCNTPNADISL